MNIKSDCNINVGEGNGVYFSGVEPDQVEWVEVERRVRAVEDGPSAELCGSEAWDYDTGEFRVVAGEVSAVDGWAVLVHGDESEKEDDNQDSHFGFAIVLFERERERERNWFVKSDMTLWVVITYDCLLDCEGGGNFGAFQFPSDRSWAAQLKWSY